MQTVRPKPDLPMEKVKMVQIEEDVRRKVKGLLTEIFQFDNQDLNLARKVTGFPRFSLNSHYLRISCSDINDLRLIAGCVLLLNTSFSILMTYSNSSRYSFGCYCHQQ